MKLFILFFASTLAFSSAEEQKFREFTDKNGAKINAALLDISDDGMNVTIRREDGAEFAMPVNKLSLGDQQFIGSWAMNRPAPEIADSFQLRLEPKLQESEPEEFSRGVKFMARKMDHYEVVIENLSRETLKNAKLEYVIIWDDQVLLKTDNDGTKAFILQKQELFVGQKGTSEIPAIGYNREGTLKTGSFEMSRAYMEDGKPLGDDRLLGVFLRVVGPGGAILVETRYPEKELEGFDWNKAVALPAPEMRE